MLYSVSRECFVGSVNASDFLYLCYNEKSGRLVIKTRIFAVMTLKKILCVLVA